MDDHVRQAKALAVVRLSRSPGWRELLELLDEIAAAISREAFDTDDDNKAVHFLYEARGARKVVTQFKNRVASLADEMTQELHG